MLKHTRIMKMEVKDSKQLRQYSNKQNILVVGEGDFSFSLSLTNWVCGAFGSASNITATSLDIREDLGRYYNNGESNVEELKRLGCNVVHGVNVHSMASDNRLARYDLIVFNFPRAGKHNEVVRGFMESAREMLKDEVGEIHVTRLTTIHPFNLSDIKAIAEESGLRFIKKMQFNKLAFLDEYKREYERNYCVLGFPFGSLTFMFQKQ